MSWDLAAEVDIARLGPEPEISEISDMFDVKDDDGPIRIRKREAGPQARPVRR